MAVSHVYNQTVADGTATSVVRPSDWNSAHNQYMTLAGNTAGASTISGTNIVFQGGSNITLSVNAQTIIFDASNALTTASPVAHTHGNPTLNLTNISGTTASASNGLTLSLSANATAAAFTLNNWRPLEPNNASLMSSFGQNSVSFQHLIAENLVQFSTIEFFGRGTIVSSTNAQTLGQTFDYGLYSQGTGASTSQMLLMTSSQMLMTHTMNSSSANGFTYQVPGTTFTSTTNNTSMMSGLSGYMHFYLPYSGTLTPGVKYAVGMRVSTSTAGTNGGFRMFPLLQTYLTSNAGRLSMGGLQNASVTVIGDRELGFYSTTTGALPSTYATSQLSISANRQAMVLNFEI